MLLGDAVNRDIVRVKVVARVNEPHVRANLTAILKSDDANLANAAHPRVRGL